MTTKTNFEDQFASSYLSAQSANYIEDLYELYLSDPNQVSEDWRACFHKLVHQAENGQASADVPHTPIRTLFFQLGKQAATIMPPQATVDRTELTKQFRMLRLIDAYRSHGHLHAQLDPLVLTQRHHVSDLDLAYHGLKETDLDQVYKGNVFLGANHCSLKNLLQSLQKTYCGKIGIEYMHISNPEEREWLQQRIEPNLCQPDFNEKQKIRILERLQAAEGMERYLGTRYVGQKRFSLEGGESLIPALDSLIQFGGEQGIQEIVLGMAHRGRLNVLVNILGKSPGDLFAEFEGQHYDALYSGDVKYHKGFSSDVMTPGGVVHLALAFNPSHLEIISPVVEGAARARQDRRDQETKAAVLPVLIHGDAAFAGQGVVMETFSLSKARGFDTGGSVHIIINNQIGFTTSNPLDARSTLYCSDVAKMVQSPVFHVNGDDPEAVVFATQIALEFRLRFQKDVLIDLVCYRRHGHNEADEPAATQPIMYQVIRKHTSVPKLYAEKLIAETVIDQNSLTSIQDNYRKAMDAGEDLTPVSQKNEYMYSIDWKKYEDSLWDEPVKTTIAFADIKKLSALAYQLPKDFTLQPQVAKVVNDRLKMAAGELEMDWGFAEIMAYAALIHDGYPVRFTGQDSRRGTFAHRHATLHDYKNGQEFTPLEHIKVNDSRALTSFTIIDSLLSEEAVLAFEYGYATASPEELVIWEAQFGDFVNGAQVVIDQFISSGEQKWGRLCGLTMFLPHGYEGQGPEHSSARLERFLQLCAQRNIQVCVPSTPAQTFHMLRRQMIRPYRKPLIVMTPKSLLRHKLAVSPLSDLHEGKFWNVIPELDILRVKKVKRVVLCSGKVYYDLLQARREQPEPEVALIRVEQLYPFPVDDLKAELEKYFHVKDVIWCQEEPKNQGAWYCTQHWLRASLAKGQELHYIGRESSAAPAVGSPSLHLKQQQAVVKQALSLDYQGEE